jgi:hypothetical protein
VPPVKRGDIERLLEREQTPGVVAIADGTFHAYPSVSHVEIRNAVNAGWKIYGLCSMGAIRAAEMRHLGVIPWGRVASMFCEKLWLADDEVALVHGSEAPYVPLSEPLIHIREFLDWASKCKSVDSAQADQIIESIRNRWYGERTLAFLEKQLQETLGVKSLSAQLREGLDNFSRFRLKQKDLASFVKSRPWQLGE